MSTKDPRIVARDKFSNFKMEKHGKRKTVTWRQLKIECRAIPVL